MTELDLAPFLDLRRHLRIAHHIPGRIRLRIGASVFKELGGVDRSLFDRILGAIDGITDVRVNAAAGSVVIAYAPGKIQSQWWDTLLNAEDGQAIGLLHQLLDGALAPAARVFEEP
jgi:predicted ABC-class ATPase